MNFQDYKFLVRSDLCRINGQITPKEFIYQILLEPGFKYMFWFRTCAFFSKKGSLYLPFYIFARLMLRHYTFKYGIDIPYGTTIGSGFYIGHFGGIVVNPQVTIGKNCNISQGITLGIANRGERPGCPIIGDSVFIGPGAKIIGKIRIGNNAAIGANAVVTKDVPDSAVVVGVPAKVISDQGSEGYIHWIDY